MCPDCRFVFRVPRDHDGVGAVCPSCRRLLKVPKATDVPPPLMAAMRQDVAELPVLPESRQLKKRRRGTKAAGDHSWEQQLSSSSPTSSSSSTSSSVRVRKGEKRQMLLMLIGGAMLLVLILTGVFYSMKDRPAEAVTEVQSGEGAPVVTEVAAGPAASSARAQGEGAFLVEAEPLAQRFLAATSVEELLPLVRDPATSEARMRDFYPNGEVEAPGLANFNLSRQVSFLGKVGTVAVRTGDFEDRLLAFVETPEGLKIDWESWVGWSGIPWQEFTSSMPTSGHLFRVILSPVEYYNFAFADESEWQSYRLESPDRQHAIYGYAPRGSVLSQRVRPPGESKRAMLTLLLKFPVGAESNTQVEIESLLAEGWVEGADVP